MRKTTAHLAPGSELRRDPLTREQVVVAAHRQSRTHLPPSDQCPLCPSTDDRHTEVPAADYDVVAFENRFPSLQFVPGVADGTGAEAGFFGGEGTLETRAPASGRCEVIVF